MPMEVWQAPMTNANAGQDTLGMQYLSIALYNVQLLNMHLGCCQDTMTDAVVLISSIGIRHNRNAY